MHFSNMRTVSGEGEGVSRGCLPRGCSSGWVRGGDKHEIYAAEFGSHLFYDLFSQGHDPLGHSGSVTGVYTSLPWTDRHL